MTTAPAEILREYGDQFVLIEGVERKGKTHGMNRLVALADTSIVVFTDANVMIDPEAIANLRSYFADARSQYPWELGINSWRYGETVRGRVR